MELIRFIIAREGFDKTYNRGIDFFNKKMYDGALECFRMALTKPDPRPQVYYNLALCHQYLNEIEIAKKYYLQFLDLKPEDYDGLYNLALIFYTQKDFDKSIEYFERCANIKTDEDGIKALALAYLSANKFEKAIELGNKIPRSDENRQIYYTLAKVFESKNSINMDTTYVDQAINMYFKLLERFPNDFDILMSLSISYAKKGEWENSVIYCQQALDVSPKSYDANNQMGLVYYCCNDVEKSIQFYEVALKLNPKTDYKIYSNLAYAYEKAGNIPKAIRLFRKMIAKFPEYPAIEELKNHIRIIQMEHKIRIKKKA